MFVSVSITVIICSGGQERDGVGGGPVDDRLDDGSPVSADDRGHHSIEMCIREICSRGSRTVEHAATNCVDRSVLEDQSQTRQYLI